ncbi:sulfotransferase family 2 domain-containing protein [Flavimaricola marinus]|uniref:Sulfotransferase family protein n=1 Tax=Flavimaricola marinus TaxID=1819565 RepID=A0A238LHR2_9RHOB|nr:sulfotransferase family 2 domain-containing protein [Flavimaricola marinus]SMY09229.1 Sulfotransferase family protein [Flavimaricola marinus]
MAIISHPNRFIYFLNPRTASTATGQALTEALPCVYVPEADIMDDKGKIVVQRKHTTPRQLREYGLVEPEVLETFFKFVTVRNPYDSIVSAWAKKVKDYAHLLDKPDSWVNKIPGYADGLRRASGMTFAEWVVEEYAEHLKKGRKARMNGNFIDEVDHILRYETLAEDFAAITDRLGLPADFVLPQVNVTKGRDTADYRSYYDDAAREVISTVFRDEIERLGYSF